ncbi:MAG: hypothetical protein JO276_11890 [Sphingomonadaceae bacterium]|nr:hypothetical protein [Sphingomonadaceae bacterium]
MRLATLVSGIFLSTAAAAGGQPPPAGQLDFLAGDWRITDSAGREGRSRIIVQGPGAMLFELREIGGDGPLPLWFEYAERTHGWLQLFPGPNGLREFALESPAGAWPMVFGAEVALQDGSRARFRLTMTRASADESRRLLELSRDGGRTWSPVFDYLYRRVPAGPDERPHR